MYPPAHVGKPTHSGAWSIGVFIRREYVPSHENKAIDAIPRNGIVFSLAHTRAEGLETRQKTVSRGGLPGRGNDTHFFAAL
jgi:hypothetical protein